jgi:hypothetical protein
MECRAPATADLSPHGSALLSACVYPEVKIFVGLGREWSTGGQRPAQLGTLDNGVRDCRCSIVTLGPAYLNL